MADDNNEVPPKGAPDETTKHLPTLAELQGSIPDLIDPRNPEAIAAELLLQAGTPQAALNALYNAILRASKE